MDDVDSLSQGVALLLLDLLDDVTDSLGELKDSELVLVTDVDGSLVGTVHQEDETVNQVVDVLE